MAAVFSRVKYVFRTYPLTRGMASYAVIWPIGSLVQQSIQGKKEYDYGRVARFSFYGCCFVAPTLYTWIKIAGAMFPAATLRHAVCKALVEQVTYTPAAMICFYFFMTLLEGETCQQARKEVAEKFIPTYKIGAVVWPILQTFNYTMIPPRNRVPFVSVCSLCWTTFLAYMKQIDALETKTAPEDVEDVVLVENLTYGPFHNVSFYTLMTLLHGGTWEEAMDEVKQKFWPTWKTAVCFWPAAQLINFMYVPEHNRVVYVSVLSLVWITFLAFMKEQETKHREINFSNLLPMGIGKKFSR